MEKIRESLDNDTFEDFYNNEQKQNVSLSLSIYGYDYCYSMLDPAAAHREQITMPVYGIAYTANSNPETAAITGAEKHKSGYFAILEEGSSLASLQLEFGGVVHPFANVYTYFKPFPSDEYDLSDTISEIATCFICPPSLCASLPKVRPLTPAFC